MPLAGRRLRSIEGPLETARVDIALLIAPALLAAIARKNCAAASRRARSASAIAESIANPREVLRAMSTGCAASALHEQLSRRANVVIAARSEGPRPAKSFWPREHGAYVQLLAPLVCAFTFVRPTRAALACAALACAVFLAHEPLLVLLGRRGSGCRARHARAAWTHLLVRLTAALLSALVVALLAPPAVAFGLILPAGLGLCMLATILLGRERSLVAELLAATALTSFCVPVLLAQGVSPGSTLVFVGAWSTVQLLATLTAHAYVYRRRDGEGRLAVAALSSPLLIGLAAVLVERGDLPLATGAALLPFAAVAVALHLRAYRPRTPKAVGWALVMANLTAVALLGTALLQSG